MTKTVDPKTKLIASSLIIAVFVVVANLIVDICYSVLDPRVKLA